MLAIVGAVLATAYYWATKPGELLSFWATWINGVYTSRTLMYQTPIPGKEGNVAWLAGASDAEYFDDAVKALKEYDFSLLHPYEIYVDPIIGGGVGGYFVRYNGTKQHLRNDDELDRYLSQLAGPELTYMDNDANEKRFNDYQWVLKPILTCERCIGGQFGFWLSVLAIVNGGYMSLLSILFVVALTSLLSSLIVKEFNR